MTFATMCLGLGARLIPCVDLNNVVARLSGNYVRHGGLSQSWWSCQQKHLPIWTSKGIRLAELYICAW